MDIKGFQGTTLLDFPGRIAALIFCGGCNLRCPYCHNPALVEAPQELPSMPLDDLWHQLSRRQGFIDGVVISGGEPTLQQDLLPFMERCRKHGLLVKLDTNGLQPQVLQDCLQAQLVDYVALDGKTAPHRYNELGGPPEAGGSWQQSLDILSEFDGEWEVRTTCEPTLVGQKEIKILAGLLPAQVPWYLQQFQPAYAASKQCRNQPAYGPQQLQELAALARQQHPQVMLRGV